MDRCGTPQVNGREIESITENSVIQIRACMVEDFSLKPNRSS